MFYSFILLFSKKCSWITGCYKVKYLYCLIFYYYLWWLLGRVYFEYVKGHQPWRYFFVFRQYPRPSCPKDKKYPTRPFRIVLLKLVYWLVSVPHPYVERPSYPVASRFQDHSCTRTGKSLVGPPVTLIPRSFSDRQSRFQPLPFRPDGRRCALSRRSPSVEKTSHSWEPSTSTGTFVPYYYRTHGGIDERVVFRE